MYKRLIQYIEENNILPEEQSGFRTNRSCRDNIFVLTQLHQHCKAARRPLFAAFLDVAKAFDTVDRDLLTLKLLHHNISGRFLATLLSLFKGDQSVVVMGTDRSQPFPHERGVRQGDPLSPLLYALANNDLLTTATSMSPNGGVSIVEQQRSLAGLSYADDVVLLADSAEQLQNLLNGAYYHANQNHYAFNPPKCKVMVVGCWI